MTRVVFWGSGNAFKLVYSMFRPEQIEILGVVDKNEISNIEFEYIPPTDLMNKEFDLLMISSLDYCDEIKEEAVQLGVESRKILTPYISERALVKWNYLLSDRGLQVISFLKMVRAEEHTELITRKAEKLEKKVHQLEKEIERLERADRDIRIDRDYRPIREFYERKSAEEFYQNFISKRKAESPLRIFRGRDEFRAYMASQAIDKRGLLLEFGVFQGRSINIMSEVLKDRVFYGFDSFEGLPDDWHDGYVKGRFSLEGKMPEVNKNVELIKGWFDETLPSFLEKHSEDIALIHIDCDIYSSTNYVLETVQSRIKPGTIIIFDELLGYVDYENHELLALNKMLQTNNYDYEYLASSFVWNENGHYVAVAIEIKEK